MNERRFAPRSCPVCGERLALTRLGCPECDTELSGVFEACEFCSLDADDRDMLHVFLRSRGNMKELERHLGVSYPTVRARFDKLLARLGLESEEEPDRIDLLEALSRGEIDVGEALERLE
ncbi:MAG TPA: DUF2089 domain-containing protein [Actinomycetota bacterium]|jgi:hypothetical protein|nr:DUF2089 domain-containing protein [Actinomycetota bacterium]